MKLKRNLYPKIIVVHPPFSTNNQNRKKTNENQTTKMEKKNNKVLLETESDFSLYSELAWSEWSPCSSTCNWGRRTRTSYCLDNGLNLERCAEASSKRSETEACFVKLCAIASTTTSTIATTPITTPMPTNYTAGKKKSAQLIVCYI